MSRNKVVDNAKGLGIVLVVLGHNWIVRDKGELFRIIFSFHMPLFFFLAGVFLNERARFGPFVGSRASALLRPYFSILVLLGLAKTAALYTSHESTGFRPADYFLGVLYGTGPTLAWTPLWFLPHLFVTSVFSLAVLKVLADSRARVPAWAALVPPALLLIGIPCLGLFWAPVILADPSVIGVRGVPGLPWSLDLIPITSAFLIAGYLMRRQAQSSTFSGIRLLLSASAFGLLHCFFDETIDLNLRLYGEFLIATAQAVLGIHIIVQLASLLATSRIASRVFGYLGAGSLFILIFHDFIQRKTFEVLAKHQADPGLGAAASFAFAILTSLAIWELAKRYRFLSWWVLPRQRAASRVLAGPPDPGHARSVG